MGFLTRLLIPRSVRRAARPVRTAKRAVRRAVVPKPIRQVTYGASQLKNPIRAAVYHGIERPLTTGLRGGARKTSRTPAPVYQHGNCPVKHRSLETAQRCAQASNSPARTLPGTEGPKEPSALTKVQLRDQALTDMTWLLQQPEFDSKYLEESVPELGPLLDEGEFGEAANLLVHLRLLGGGNTKALTADFADFCANARRQIAAIQRPSGHEVETAATGARVRAGRDVQTRNEAVRKAEDDGGPSLPTHVGPDSPRPPSIVDPRDAPMAPSYEPVPSHPGEGLAAAASPERPAGPTIEQLTRQADAIIPDLRAVDEAVYFDYEHNRPLPLKLRTLANEIVLDWEFDGGAGHPAARRRLAQLSASDSQVVGTVASRVWYGSVYSALEPLAQQLALRLAEDPDYDPLPWGEWLDDFVRTRLDGHRPALIWITRQALFANAESSGQIQRNEAEVKQAAQAALSRMGPLERDVYGFTSRNARRRQLASDYLNDIRPTRHELIIYWMSRFEREQSGAQRDARYATASRRLTVLGEGRAAISRLLGISASVLDRVERENRSDVELAPDDPILTDLAPQLRR